ncbi:DNA helicase [Tanacetum coccineum]
MCHPYYIGCIRSVSDLTPFGDPNRRQSTRRKIEIKNFNGNIIELTLWDEMAEHFGQSYLEKMDQPVIIAVSSCRVSKLSVSRKPGSSLDTKKLLHSLSANLRIKTLRKGSLGTDTHRNSKAASDSLGTAPLTFFSPAADKITKHPCEELFHFNTFANTTDLTLDKVFDIKTTYKSTSSIAKQTYKGTSSITPAAAVQPVENQKQEAKGKEKIAGEQTNKGKMQMPHSDTSTSTIRQQFQGAINASISRRIPLEVQGTPGFW